MEELARERAYAWRRADLMRALATTLDDVGDGGWRPPPGRPAARPARLVEDSDARAEVLARFAPVALALFEAAPDAAPETALAAFEAWYLSTRQSAFWYLFEHYLPDTPLVDF